MRKYILLAADKLGAPKYDTAVKGRQISNNLLIFKLRIAGAGKPTICITSQNNDSNR
jgi:hypothetical protein